MSLPSLWVLTPIPRLFAWLQRWQPGALLVLDFARGEHGGGGGGAGAAGLGELFVGEVWGATLLRQSGARMWCGGPPPAITAASAATGHNFGASNNNNNNGDDSHNDLRRPSTPPAPFWWREANAPLTRCVPGDASPHGFRIVLQRRPGYQTGARVCVPVAATARRGGRWLRARG